MGKFGLITMLLVILSASTVLAAVSREQVVIDLIDRAEANLAEAWTHRVEQVEQVKRELGTLQELARSADERAMGR